jgi:tetratricopeptide (TPR) repeat protein
VNRKSVLLICVGAVLIAPLAAQDFFVKEWQHTYSTEEQKEIINHLAVADLDKDGLQEIVAAMSLRPKAGLPDYAVVVMDSKGTKKYQWTCSYPVNELSLADLDGDGFEEILVSTADLYILSYKAQNLNYPQVGTVVFTCAADDLDKDGNAELLVGTREVICRGKTVSWRYNIGSQIKKIIITDLTWDEVPEIIVLTLQNVHVFDIYGNKLWTSPGAQNLLDMAVADSDGDREKEIFVSTDDRKIYIWQARSDGMRRELALKSSRADILAVADLNQDEIPEIIVASSLLRLEVLDLNGNLLWQYRFERKELRDEFTDMVVTDLNRDTWPDILLSQSVSAMAGDLDSFLFFLKNQAGIVPSPDKGSEYYEQALAMFNEGNCAEAVNLFSQARTAFLESDNQEMADTCQDYIQQCEVVLELEAADAIFAEAEVYFEQGQYQEALPLYQDAMSMYEELGKNNEVEACSDRIAEIEALSTPEEEEESQPTEKRRPVGILLIPLIVAAVGIGAYVLVKSRGQKTLQGIVEKKEEAKPKKEEPEEPEEPEKKEVPDFVKNEERKLKAQFVYGEINREEYREALRKLYEAED